MTRSVPSLVLFVATSLFGLGAARAETEGPVSLSLVPPVQIVPKHGSVYGFRLNLVGQNQTVHGLDVGVVNWVERDFVGFQWLGFGWVEGDAKGVQWNYLANITQGRLEGGQLGLFNLAREKSAGAQLGFVSWSETDFTGLEAGLVAYSPTFSGLQFGLINVTDRLRGLQVGLVNVAENGFLPIFPIINFHFDD